MSVLIGGGTGFVGRHVSKMLKDKGYQVISVSRTAGKEKITWDDVKKNGIPSGCIAVVNVAGENILNPFKRMGNKDYIDQIYKSRIDTSKLFVKAITEAEKRPEVFVTMSGVGYYPPSKTEKYTEFSASNGNDWLGRLSKEWEAAGNLPDNVDTRRVIVRSGVILGKDGGMIQTLKPLFCLSMMQRIGTGTQSFPWIHVTDMAGIITHAIENDVIGILNGVAPDVIDNAAFTKAIAESMKLKLTFGFVPEFYMKLVFGAERAMVVLEGQKVIPERTLQSGYNYFYPDIKTACDQLAA